MGLKTAAFLAFIGTLLVTALLVWDLVFTIIAVLRGLMPAVRVFSTFIYAFAAFTVMLFFFAFQRRQV